MFPGEASLRQRPRAASRDPRASVRAARASGLVAGLLGFTLIELVVTIAVVGLIMGVVVSRLDRTFELNMKKASNSFASMIRYLYNKAALEKLYLRLVIDLEGQTYWVEATSDPLVVTMEEEGAKGGGQQEADQGKPEEGLPAGGSGAEEEKEDVEGALVPPGTAKLKPPKPRFGQVDAFLLRPGRLPDGVFFKDLQVEHRRHPVEGGKESIHFFPNGYVERAIINLRDEEDEVHYSLRTHPLNGQVDIENDYRSLAGQ